MQELYLDYIFPSVRRDVAMARGVRGVSIARFVARSECFDTPLNPLSHTHTLSHRGDF